MADDADDPTDPETSTADAGSTPEGRTGADDDPDTRADAARDPAHDGGAADSTDESGRSDTSGERDAAVTEASVEIQPGARHLETPDTDSPVLAIVFMAGLLAFVGSVIVLIVALMTGGDPIRPVAINAVSAAVLVGWAGHDTLTDPDSEVATVGGALGTAVLLFGIYLFVLGLVLVGTSFQHDRTRLGLASAGAAVVLVVVGFLVFPTEAVADGDSDGESAGDSGDGPGTDDAGTETRTGDRDG